MSLLWRPLALVPVPAVCVVAEALLRLATERRAEAVRKELAALEGQALRVLVDDLGWGMDLWHVRGVWFVRPAGAREPAARLQGSSGWFARIWLLGETPQDLVMANRITATGDAKVLQAFSDFFAGVDARWPDLLAGAFGERTARRITEGMRRCMQAAERAEARARKELTRGAVAAGAVRREEMEALHAGAEHLARRVRRLEARVQRLEARRRGQDSQE